MEDAIAKRLILVVESNLDHAHLIEQELQQSSVPHEIVVIADGLEATDYLHGQGIYAKAARPDLILLDLTLTGRSGKELLLDIKATPYLRRIPVIVLTLSSHAEDILTTYTLQGNCYVIKSTDLAQLSRLVRRIEEFWLGIVTLPVE